MRDELGHLLDTVRLRLQEGQPAATADDLLTWCRHLLVEVADLHERQLVMGPDLDFNGLELALADPEGRRPTLQSAALAKVMREADRAVHVVSRLSARTDLDSGVTQVDAADVYPDLSAVPTPVEHPVHVGSLHSWEEALGHHDSLVDIAILGQLMLALVTGLDPYEADDIEALALARDRLSVSAPQLHPVVARLLREMTDLDRVRRSPDLAEVLMRLDSYREVPEDFDVDEIDGYRTASPELQRRLLHTTLRDRLFDTSRRNKLLWFSPTAQTVDLTVGSVPQMLDHRGISPDALLTWQGKVAATLSAGKPLSLTSYLRFDESPYLSPTLDKAIATARRDRAEYGFAQLRLVVAFLRWHDLKATKGPAEEVIESPLLMLPVDLSKKKGVRDSYVVTPAGPIAEVNPALRHRLGELYDLQLPESVDLSVMTVEQFHAELSQRIEASEPAVSLVLKDKPQIDLVQRQARLRTDAFRRRQQAARSRTRASTDYSYSRDDYRPLGIQIFNRKVLPPALPQRVVAGGTEARTSQFAAEAATGDRVLSQQTYQLRKGATTGDPYSWAVDLCRVTIGNFNYRRMSLVHDYEALIEEPPSGSASEVVFHTEPRPLSEPSSDDLVELYPVVASDATQLAAVARARGRASYVIQGPPGTGKSQTITNLISDQVSLGRSVLFVCEKRAAVDVVYSRLRQRGLGSLCCLVHDAQGDKKAFIADLKSIYEGFIESGAGDADSGLFEAQQARDELLTELRSRLENLRRLSEAMSAEVPDAGRTAFELVDQLVRLRGELDPLPELSDEQAEGLPPPQDWWQAAGPAAELERALSALGEDPRIAGHYVTALGDGVLQADRPVAQLRRLVDQARPAVLSLEGALATAVGLPPVALENLGSLARTVDTAEAAQVLVRAGTLDLLGTGKRVTQFDALAAEYESRERARQLAWQRASGWCTSSEPSLDSEGAAAAFAVALRKEGRAFAGFSGKFRAARSAVVQGFHGEPPQAGNPVTSSLELLVAAYIADAAVAERHQLANRDFGIGALPETVAVLGSLRAAVHGPEAALRSHLLGKDGPQVVEQLTGLAPALAPLRAVLTDLLLDLSLAPVDDLGEFLDDLESEADLLPPLLPALREVATCPISSRIALLEFDLTVVELTYCTAKKALGAWLATDRAVARLDGTTIDRRVDELAEIGTQLQGANAEVANARVRSTFLSGVVACSLPAAQLDADGKLLKKNYLAGRRELEHEFGKVMRHKPVRTLATGPTGKVLRDLKPVWLMSPLSVSDTLPLDPALFDVVIFDEASQVPVEEAVPALFRAPQVIVVGDQMQLPPTNFFSASPGEDDLDDEAIGITLEGDSFLAQASATLPSTLLAWHYRSRSEALIGFSNAAFYGAALRTVPDRDLPGPALTPIIVTDPVADGAYGAQALLDRPLSSHLLQHGTYSNRRNIDEAAYIAGTLRELLRKRTGHTVGIVAFSEAQQGEIEDAIERLAGGDPEFAALVEEETLREVDGQQVGLFVKNLENVQGDERDVIILSICYARDPQGRMRMNFGPVNQNGGEKRLNVIFSRAKRHMAVVTSIRAGDITNTWNTGASALSRFLAYAEATSVGDPDGAARVLGELASTGSRASGAVHAVVEQLSAALETRGHVVDRHVGQSSFRVDLAVRASDGQSYALGVLVDTSVVGQEQVQEQYVDRPRALTERGWVTTYVLAKDWLDDPEECVARLERILAGETPIEKAEAPIRPRRTERRARLVAAVEGSTHAEPQPASQGAVNATNPIPASRSQRRFEFVGDGSSKFWAVSVDESTLSVQFGRIGTAGQLRSKQLGTQEAAQREADKLVAEKLGKGYREVS